MDHLRQGIGLRAYAQRDPLNEYKSEAFELFEAMLSRLREAVTASLAHLEIRMEMPVGMPESPDSSSWNAQQDDAFANLLISDDTEDLAASDDGDIAVAPSPARTAAAAAVIDPADPSTWGKVPRNAMCPCGSGKKFKHCHGARL